MSDKKILAISAFHPPDHTGGYEIRIKDVLDGLSYLGNYVKVITTKPNRKTSLPVELSQYPIRRVLCNRYDAKWFPKELWHDLLDTKTLEREITQFRPDIIYLGHIYPLTKQLLPFLSSLGIPIVCDEGGNSLKGAWTDHGRWFDFAGDYRSRFRLLNMIKPAVVRLVLWISKGQIKTTWTFPENLKIIFNSELNRCNAKFFGVPVENARVIYSGVDTDKFTFRPKESLSNPIKILIPGRIETKKGQLDGVNLIHELQIRGIEAELLLVGHRTSDGYYDDVKNNIDALNLAGKVRFIPMVDSDQLVDFYHQADICFFCSYHQSGFSRVPLEAMACGCVVISYGNEGSNEIIRNEVSGFLVAPGDILSAAEIVSRLVKSDNLVRRVIVNGRDRIGGEFNLRDYLSQIEDYMK